MTTDTAPTPTPPAHLRLEVEGSPDAVRAALVAFLSPAPTPAFLERSSRRGPKLTSAAAESIRQAAAAGMLPAALAAKYRVREAAIDDIIAGRTYPPG